MRTVILEFISRRLGRKEADKILSDCLSSMKEDALYMGDLCVEPTDSVLWGVPEKARCMLSLYANNVFCTLFSRYRPVEYLTPAELMSDDKFRSAFNDIQSRLDNSLASHGAGKMRMRLDKGMFRNERWYIDSPDDVDQNGNALWRDGEGMPEPEFRRLLRGGTFVRVGDRVRFETGSQLIGFITTKDAADIVVDPCTGLAIRECPEWEMEF